MKKLAILLLTLLLTGLLTACATEPGATQSVDISRESLAQTTEHVYQEEDALIGTWSNGAGITARFWLDDDTGYRFSVLAEGHELTPNEGAYEIEDGVLRLGGWFSENETEYSFEGNRLTLELNGCSFTLTKQTDVQEPTGGD